MKEIVEIEVLKTKGNYTEYVAMFYVELNEKTTGYLNLLVSDLRVRFLERGKEEVTFLQKAIDKEYNMLNVLTSLTDAQREIISDELSIEKVETSIAYLNESLNEEVRKPTEFSWRTSQRRKLIDDYNDMLDVCLEFGE